jgi:cytochrome c-type biogenesis protein CcmH/NrfG
MESAAEQAKAKNPNEAIKLYSQILRDDPNDFVAWTELGSVYFANSNITEAEKAYRKAIALKADFTLALFNLGKLYLSEKRFPEAVLVFENAVMSDKLSADGFHYLGEAYLQNKQGSKAVPVLNEAIRLAPNEKADIHLRLATLYNAANMKDRAANEYRLFLQKRPDHKERAKLENYIKENSK